MTENPGHTSSEEPGPVLAAFPRALAREMDRPGSACAARWRVNPLGVQRARGTASRVRRWWRRQR